MFAAGPRRAAFARPPGPPLLLVHMPKTAGTSLRRMLQATLGMNAVWPSDEDLRRRADGMYPAEEDVLAAFPTIRPYFCLTGHFFASFADHLPVPHRTAVFVRDPVERSLSTLAHFVKTLGTPPERLLDDDAFVDVYLRNCQTKMLGGDRGHPSAAVTTGTLRAAMERVDAFDFVGLTDRFQDSCAVFDAVFGTAIGRSISRENVMRPRGTEYAEFVPRIAPLVELDHVLHAHAVTRFRTDHRRGQIKPPPPP